MNEPTISRCVVNRLCRQFPKDLYIAHTDDGEFLVKDNGINDDGTHLAIVVFAKIVEDPKEEG